MTELAALNIKITGDSKDLQTAVAAANGDLAKLVAGAEAAGLKVQQFGKTIPQTSRGLGDMRGQIQNVSFQLQDMAVQLAAGTSASVVFAQQGSQIASAFGPMGAVIGALAAVGIPLLAYAFSNAAESASQLSTSMTELADATEAFRIQADALRFGVDEQEVVQVRELNRLMTELNRINAEWQSTDSLGARQRLAEEASAIKAQIASQQQSLNEYRKAREEARLLQAANEGVTKIQKEMELILRRIAGIDLTSPWQTVVGYIQEAINKANEYAAASFGMSTGSADWTKGQMGFTRPGEELLPPVAPALGGGGGGGGGGVNPIQAELEAMQQSLMTQEQLQMESYQRQQDVLAQALQQRLITQQQYAAMMEQVEATHGAAMQNQSRANASEVLGNLQTVFQGSKKIGAAIALANSYLAFTEVLKDPSYIGRPFARFAAAAAALSSGLQAVRSIKSASPGGGGGGSVGGATGGASTSQASASPLQVSLNTFGAGDFIRTADFGMILDRLNREAGDRGYTILSMPA